MFRKIPKLISIRVFPRSTSNYVFMDFIFKARRTDYFYPCRMAERNEISRLMDCNFMILEGCWDDARCTAYRHRVVLIPDGRWALNV